MTDQATGDMPEFLRRVPTPPTPEPTSAKQPRQRRIRKEPALAAPYGKAAEALAPKKTRKPREAKAERAAPETIKVTLKEFATMRVGEENAKAFIKAHGILAAIGKNARAKVLGELQKVLG